jgi:biotin carboxyl carrier protein
MSARPLPNISKPSLEPEPPSSRRAWAGLLLFVAVVGCGGAWVWHSLSAGRQAAERAASLRTMRRFKVQRGNLNVDVRVTGTLSARVFANIVAPRLTGPESDREMTLIRLTESGTHVQAGEVVAEFDSQAAKDHLDDTRDGLNDRRNTVKLAKARLDTEFLALLQQLDQARAAMEKARWDLKSIPVRSAIQAEKFRLALEEAEATYRAQVNALPVQMASQAAQQGIYEVAQEVEELHVKRHENDLARLTIKAPVEGMVVLQSTFRPGGQQATVQKGDRMYPGSQFLRVIDTRTLQVEGTVNQSELERFRVGQPASIRLDGIPGAVYHGRIHAIGVLATTPGRQQYYLRTVPIRVEVLDPDARMLPDLTASADVRVETVENVLLAPSEAVKAQDGQSYVMVETPRGLERRGVTRGRASSTQTVLTAGVSEGDVVVIE